VLIADTEIVGALEVAGIDIRCIDEAREVDRLLRFQPQRLDLIRLEDNVLV
jgi:hypothetical protein